MLNFFNQGKSFLAYGTAFLRHLCDDPPSELLDQIPIYFHRNPLGPFLYLRQLHTEVDIPMTTNERIHKWLHMVVTGEIDVPKVRQRHNRIDLQVNTAEDVLGQ